jgi:plasmid stabilization system protein ParE
MSGYALHPEAYADLDDIRGYIAQDNPDAADRIVTEIFDTIRGLVDLPVGATDARTLPHSLSASLWYVNT